MSDVRIDSQKDSDDDTTMIEATQLVDTVLKKHFPWISERQTRIIALVLYFVPTDVDRTRVILGLNTILSLKWTRTASHTNGSSVLENLVSQTTSPVEYLFFSNLFEILRALKKDEDEEEEEEMTDFKSVKEEEKLEYLCTWIMSKSSFRYLERFCAMLSLFSHNMSDEKRIEVYGRPMMGDNNLFSVNVSMKDVGSLRDSLFLAYEKRSFKTHSNELMMGPSFLSDRRDMKKIKKFIKKEPIIPTQVVFFLLSPHSHQI